MLYKSGSTFKLIGNQGQVLKNLPFGFYKIVVTMQGVHLEQCPDPVPVNLVGIARTACDTMVQLWNSSTDKNPSAMLTGASGNGKTQTAFNVAKSLDLPIILVTGHSPDIITSILECVGGPVMLLFDEFEKNYSSEESTEKSDSLLTFLDGIATSVKVFNVMTINERKKLSRFLFNRPGRILFDFKFEALSVDTALQFIHSRTKVKDVERLMAFLQKVSDLSYDICDKIIYVLSIYPDTYEDVLPHMNIEVGEVKFSISIVQKGDYDRVISTDHRAPHHNSRITMFRTKAASIDFADKQGRTIEEILKKESEVELSLDDIELFSYDTGNRLTDVQKKHKDFANVCLKVERTFIPRAHQMMYNLAY